MISLVINSKCNQKCEYCFAYNTLHDNNTFMSLETCEEILKFQAKAIDYRIKHAVGIIGGEPTLHPQFSEMLALINDYSKRYYFDPILFTNGTHLCDHEIPKGMNLTGLINVNHPDIVGKKNFNGTLKAIEKYCENFNIGINLYPGMKDYSFIFDIAKEYKINNIRVAIACPDGQYNNMINNRIQYFLLCTDIFINFCLQVIKNNMHIDIDHNYIPICLLNNKQKDIINMACNYYPNVTGNMVGRRCTANIDVHPDLTVTHCFIRPEIISIKDFSAPDELEQYININWIDKMYKNMEYEECKTCDMFRNMTCNIGCLRFSKKELNNG